MMNNVYIILFVLIGISLVLLFSKIPVPDCYPSKEKTEIQTNVTYSAEEIEEIKENVEKTTTYIVHVNGKSMEPLINHDDECLCLFENDYKIGDVVAFYIPYNRQIELISHRIIKENADGIITKGDNNNIEDPFTIKQEQIFCKIQETSLLKRFINLK